MPAGLIVADTRTTAQVPPGGRRYVLLAASAALAGTVLALALIVGTRHFGRDDLPYRFLYDHQTGKLASLDADTVIVGDSSAGNALSAALWSKLSGQKTVSLALTGNYGFAGSLNMLRRALAHGHPRNVIIMQTADILTRPVAEDAYRMTLDPGKVGRLASAMRYWRETVNVPQLSASFHWLFNRLAGRSRRAQPQLLVDDYIRQGPPKPVPADLGGLEPGQINRRKLKYLYRLAQLCRSHGLNCVFVDGPLASPRCERSAAYLREAAGLIRSTGLAMPYEQPICLPAAEVGDSYDHVRPPFKNEYTSRYWALLRDHLAPPERSQN